MLYWRKLETPIGTLRLWASDRGLCRILFPGETVKVTPLKEHPDHPTLKSAADQLTEYFDGHRKVFDVPLDLQGTDFQIRAWNSLLAIPFGRTISYKEQSLRMNTPSGFRAVGAANGRNPVPIIVPCHRVIAQNGKLQGYAGGLSVKEHLLRHEGVLLS